MRYMLHIKEFLFLSPYHMFSDHIDIVSAELKKEAIQLGKRGDSLVEEKRCTTFEFVPTSRL